MNRGFLTLVLLLLCLVSLPAGAQVDKGSIEGGSFRFINGGPVVGAGGNASQATILVNGVDMTDQVNGLARARFSQDAVHESPRGLSHRRPLTSSVRSNRPCSSAASTRRSIPR